MNTIKVTVVMGTRPEIIKLSPVIRQLKARPNVECFVVFTGQHEEMGLAAMKMFGIVPDATLQQYENRGLPKLVAMAYDGLVWGMTDEWKPDWMIVQGDTASALAGAMAAFFNNIPLAHVEAGLRTYDPLPYPEEVTRRCIDTMSQLLFAPTKEAAKHLEREEMQGAVHVVGNTVIDALLIALNQRPSPHYNSDKPLVLVTTHRRENWDKAGEIAKAIKELSVSYPWQGYNFLYSIHPNPLVSIPITSELAGSEVVVRTAIDYVSWCHLMKRASLIITDSGGIQEEAAYLGVPVALLRTKTERPEAGAVMVDYTSYNLEDTLKEIIEAKPAPSMKYGDGTSAIKIVDILLKERKN